VRVAVACSEPGCGARVTARNLEAHRARHALQQGAEQLERRPDRQPPAEARPPPMAVPGRL
jgi:hypothetical protein